MGGFRKKSIHISILDQKWVFTFWHPQAYAAQVSKNSVAELPDYYSRQVAVDLELLSAELIRHELGHCYAKERSIVEIGVKKPDDIEDFMCEIIGKHGPKICKQATQLYNFGRKIKWKTTT